MENFVKFIVSELVDDKESVQVRTQDVDGSTIITVKVNPNELGRVVGHGGRNAQAIRTLLHSLAGKKGELYKKINVKFE